MSTPRHDRLPTAPPQRHVGLPAPDLGGRRRGIPPRVGPGPMHRSQVTSKSPFAWRMKRSVISATYLAMVSPPEDPSTRARSARQVA